MLLRVRIQMEMFELLAEGVVYLLVNCCRALCTSLLILVVVLFVSCGWKGIIIIIIKEPD